MPDRLVVFEDGPLGGQRRFFPDEVLQTGWAEIAIGDGLKEPERHMYRVELRPVLVWVGPVS